MKNHKLFCIINEKIKFDIINAVSDFIFFFFFYNPPQIPVSVKFIKYKISHLEYNMPNKPITTPVIPPQTKPFLNDI